MVRVATNFYYLTFEVIANAAEVAVQFFFYRWMYQSISVFGAEYDVNIILYERLSHSFIFFYLFIDAAPSGLVMDAILFFDGLCPSLLYVAPAGLIIYDCILFDGLGC